MDRPVSAANGFYDDPATASWLAELPVFAGERELLSRLVRPGTRLSDVGSGAGRLTTFALSLGCEYRACDPAPKQIAELLRRHPSVDAHVAAGQALPWEDASADIVLLGFHVLEFVRSRQNRIAVLEEARRVLADDGVLIFSHHRASRYRLGSQIVQAVRPPTTHEREWGDVSVTGDVATAGIRVDRLQMHLLWSWELRDLARTTGFTEVCRGPMKKRSKSLGVIRDVSLMRVWKKT